MSETTSTTDSLPPVETVERLDRQGDIDVSHISTTDKLPTVDPEAYLCGFQRPRTRNKFNHVRKELCRDLADRLRTGLYTSSDGILPKAPRAIYYGPSKEDRCCTSWVYQVS
jgi:hypothetical protein